MIPIYEQIVNQVKQNIVDGKLKEGMLYRVFVVYQKI